MEKVRLDMMQERAMELRQQEDTLGSMVAQLQLNKAKEVNRWCEFVAILVVYLCIYMYIRCTLSWL